MFYADEGALELEFPALCLRAPLRRFGQIDRAIEPAPPAGFARPVPRQKACLQSVVRTANCAPEQDESPVVMPTTENFSSMPWKCGAIERDENQLRLSTGHE